MIIYKDIISGDELMSDTYKIDEVENGMLWEVNCKKYQKKAEQIELEGANPSAEGGEEDYGEEGSGEMVHDIEESFQLQWLKDEMKPSKDAFKSHLKKYVKQVNEKLKEKNASDEEIKQFQSGAAGAVKKLLRNYDNYDVLMGSSMNPEAMFVLIDFREDGVTPFATLWKHGLVGEKV